MRMYGMGYLFKDHRCYFHIFGSSLTHPITILYIRDLVVVVSSMLIREYSRHSISITADEGNHTRRGVRNKVASVDDCSQQAAYARL